MKTNFLYYIAGFLILSIAYLSFNNKNGASSNKYFSKKIKKARNRSVDLTTISGKSWDKFEMTRTHSNFSYISGQKQPYSSEDRQTFDLYKPNIKEDNSESSNLPLIVFVHSGGFITGQGVILFCA